MARPCSQAVLPEDTSNRGSQGPDRRRPSRGAQVPVWFLAACLVSACGQSLDAGNNTSQTKLPVDQRNPVILLNDSWQDNWSPEYAALFANHSGPPLAGIIVTASQYWPDINANLAGWNAFATAARAGGLRGIPDPVASAGAQLVVPPDRLVESTQPNHSAGAQLILRKSKELWLPGQPLVVLAGAQLTDVADAYLIDPTVVDHVVVVAQVGSYADPKGPMNRPNGDLDPWADWIVSQYFQYVQISVYYDQSVDVTADDLANLPKNPFGTWMATKLASFSNLQNASDQEGILAVAEPSFIVSLARSTADLSGGFNSPPGQGPPLIPDAAGGDWLITQVNATVARTRMWEMLDDARLFRPTGEP
jgi:hypothetical protein